MDIANIIAMVATMALGIGVVWARVEKVLAALKELAQVVTVLVGALEDKKLTEEEIASIKKEAGEALAAFKAVIK